MAVKRSDDHLLDRMENLFVLFENLLQAPRKRPDDTIGKQNAEEGSDQRSADHLAEDFGRFVDRSHGLDHAQHGGDDSQCGQRVGQRGQIVLRLVHLVEMRFHRIVHDLFDCMRLERARRDHQQCQSVADQRDERFVGEQIGIGAEHGGTGRILDMRFQRDRSIVLEHAHQLRGQCDRVDMVLLGVTRPLENLLECPADGLETVERIAGHHRADRGAADDQHLVGHGRHDGPERTTAERKPAKDHDEKDDNADNRVHFEFPSVGAISATLRTARGWRDARSWPGWLRAR